MAELLKVNITKQELESGIVPQNHVLMLMDFSSEGAKTKSGIIYGVLPDITYADPDNLDDTSAHAADMAETSGVIVKLPQELYFNPDDNNSMAWECDMDLEVGDRVFTNPIESQNAVTLVCEDKLYKFIPYSDCYVAKRVGRHYTYMSGNTNQEEYVICLNGMTLCEQLPRPKLSELDTVNNDTIDKTRGKIAYLGKPNKRHRSDAVADFEDLKVGDVVLFDKKYTPFALERQKYNSKFDSEKLYFVVPRCRIVAVIKRDNG
jgi:hypothetical protein